MKKRILFTGGGGAAAEALWRYLSAKYDLFFCDAAVDAIDDTIPADRKIAVPMAASEDFISAVREISVRNGIDLIVPGVDEELVPLAKSRDTGLPQIFLPSLEFVRLMLDKLACARAISNAGLSAPVTLPVSRAAEIGFPLIIKPRSGRGSKGVCRLESNAEISAYKTLYQASDDTLLAQELAVGDEYTVLVAGDDAGRLRAVIPVKVGQKKGITIRAETDMSAPVIDYASRFHEIFRPQCVYNIQCIVTGDGAVLPFEVNPRISTTFCLGVASGFDPFASVFGAETSDVFYPEKKFFLKRNWFNNIYEA